LLCFYPKKMNTTPRLLVAIALFLSFSSLSAQINEGLVAHWSFENDSEGIIYDESANEINGRGYNISYETGAVGRAVVFNNQYARIFFPDIGLAPVDTISGLASGSISIWFKYKNVGAQILPILYFGESETGTAHNSLIIEIGHGGGINPGNKRLYFTIVNKGFCFDSGENLQEDSWYHFVAVVSPEGNTGYLNGKEMTGRRYNLGSNSGYSDFFSDVPVKKMLSLGYGRYGQQDPFFTFKGSIDDVRIYNRALDANDVINLFNLGVAGENFHPDYANISYGPDQRNILDFWQANSGKPAPLVIFIHGGGFKSGGKAQATSGANLNYLKRCLQSGVSFAAINYRFRQTTRLDTILLDVARALQFIRYKSGEWNIDKDKIAVYGGSAGAGSSIWLAFHDDLADPLNDDPILRESSRVAVAGHLNGQSSYDFLRWAEIIGISPSWMDDMNSLEDLELYHIPDRSWYEREEITALRQSLDMISMIDASDAPVYLHNLNANTEPVSSGAVVHHPKHAIYLQNMLSSHQIDNAIVLAATPIQDRVDMLDFFFKYLLEPTASKENYKPYSMIEVRPIPAQHRIIVSNASGNAQIFDITGRICWQGNLSGEDEIDISGMANGIYHIRTGNTGRKFIKNASL
jgi:hypothetical protein